MSVAPYYITTSPQVPTSLRIYVVVAVALLCGAAALAAAVSASAAQPVAVDSSVQQVFGSRGFSRMLPGALRRRQASVLAGGIALDDSHACARLNNGTVKCWGYNNSGQLGNGTTANSLSPVLVSGLTGVTQIAVAQQRSCARLADTTVKCWGRNSNYINDGLADSSTPVTISGLTNVAEVYLSASHTCARLIDGTAKCWGFNNDGQAGVGTWDIAVPPTAVSGLTGVAEMSRGGKNGHTCARLTDGTMKCWGNNELGQLGDGSTTNRAGPVTVSGLTGVVGAHFDRGYTCARLADGTAKCWGFNGNGQLGDGTTTHSYVPVTVSGLTGVAELSGTGDLQHTCARLADGTAKCWGYGSQGQLGNGASTNSSSPVTVSGLSSVTALSTGNGHTCATLTDGTAKCWGNNTYGQLGDGTTTNRNTPVTVSGLAGVAEIVGGASYTCARLNSGGVRCWGQNNTGQLGDGTTTDRNTPVAVIGL